MSAVTATETGTETSRARIEDIQVQVIAKTRNINCRIGSTIIQGTINLGLSLLKRNKQIMIEYYNQTYFPVNLLNVNLKL